MPGLYELLDINPADGISPAEVEAIKRTLTRLQVEAAEIAKNNDASTTQALLEEVVRIVQGIVRSGVSSVEELHTRLTRSRDDSPTALSSGASSATTMEQDIGIKLLALYGNSQDEVKQAIQVLEWGKDNGFSLGEMSLILEAIRPLVGNRQFSDFARYTRTKAEDVGAARDAVRPDGTTGNKTLQSYLNAQNANSGDLTEFRSLANKLATLIGENAQGHSEPTRDFVARVFDKVKLSAANPTSGSMDTTLDTLGNALGVSRESGEEADTSYWNRLKSEIQSLRSHDAELRKLYDRLTKLAADNGISGTGRDTELTILNKLVRFVNGGRLPRRLNDRN